MCPIFTSLLMWRSSIFYFNFVQSPNLRNECSTIYHFVKGVNTGLNAIYPNFDQSQEAVCHSYLDQALDFARKSNDQNRSNKIIRIHEILTDRFIREEKTIENNNNHTSIGKPPLFALVVGAFSIVLLLAGQWLIGLIGLAVTYWLWKS